MPSLQVYASDTVYKINRDEAVAHFGEEAVHYLDTVPPWPGRISSVSLDDADAEGEPCENGYFPPLDYDRYTLFTPSKRNGGWTLRAIYYVKPQIYDDGLFVPGKPSCYEIEHHTCRGKYVE